MDCNFKPGFRIDLRDIKIWRMRWIHHTAWRSITSDRCRDGNDAGTENRWHGERDHSALARYYEMLAKVEISR